MSVNRFANPEKEPWHVCASEEEKEEEMTDTCRLLVSAAVLVAHGDEAWGPSLFGLEFCGFSFMTKRGINVMTF
jgi:hypothetical protein